MTTVVYRGTDGDLEPVKKECEVFGYPNRTTDGEQMYENTHFLTEEAAWRSILRSWAAGVSLASRALEDARAEEQRLTRLLADQSLNKEKAEVKHLEWFRQQPEKGDGS